MKAIVELIEKLLARRFRGSLTLHFDGQGTIPKVDVVHSGKPDEVARQL